MSKWPRNYENFCVNIDEIWNRIFQKNQSFQYKLIHKVIACNAWLKNIRIKDTATCQYCNEVQDQYYITYIPVLFKTTSFLEMF